VTIAATNFFVPKNRRWKMSNPLNRSTDDVGLAIKAALELLDGITNSSDEEPMEIIGIQGDPSNLVIHLDNNQSFTIRIIAGAR
jgi:hypothetical protein